MGLPRGQHLQPGRASRSSRSRRLIPVTGVLLLLQGIAEVIRCIMCIRDGDWPQRLHDVEETETMQEQPARARGGRGRTGEPEHDRPASRHADAGLFIFIIMLGFPIAFTPDGDGRLFFGLLRLWISTKRIFTLLVQKTFEVMSNDVLIAVPLFLFMGYMVERANILDRLFQSLQIALKNVPGSIAVATLITCAMFATATGIVGAVVTLMGLALPAMLRARLRHASCPPA